MIRQALRLVWRRKRQNALLALEIAVSFLVLFAVSTFALASWSNWRKPVGFDFHDVWNLRIDVGRTGDDEWDPGEVTTLARLLSDLAALPEVEGAAAGLSSPYSLMTRNGVWEVNGRDVEVEVNEVTDDFLRVLRLDLVRGRWFSALDDGVAWKPVVVDRDLAEVLFGGEDAIGKKLPFADDGIESRVIGVVTEFRKNGELSSPGNYMFERNRVGDPKSRPPRNLMIRMRPGVAPSFEETLVARAQASAPNWRFELKPLIEARAVAFRLRLVPLAIGAIVAGFLLLMVGLGLVGVLWQAITRRASEFALRRALGATTGDVCRQVLVEHAILAGFGLVPGLLLVAQLPLLGVLPVSAALITVSALVATAGILALAVLAALYPSLLATRVSPALALRDE